MDNEESKFEWKTKTKTRLFVQPFTFSNCGGRNKKVGVPVNELFASGLLENEECDDSKTYVRG